ncbi:hypothetical protein HOLleu_38083 [Holothuria leucospilota]|uniref:Uncharacterized protein n=1 Tax=Holothuria leucospilota TaxID=206669 RepID=A0A9Q0YMQ8_HOLLE|nr:hypothetical protein HOLleu_38083 [Holothuria leucospilota]
MKKWLGFGKPELRGAAEDDSYLTSELLDDDEISKIGVAQWNRSRLLLPSSKTKNVQQQRPSFLTNLKKWLGFSQTEPECDVYDTNESMCNPFTVQYLHEDLVRRETTSAHDDGYAYVRRLPSLMVPELPSIEKGASSSIRLSRRDRIRKMFEDVAQEKENSTDKAISQDLNFFPKRTTSTKGDPTGIQMTSKCFVSLI